MSRSFQELLSDLISEVESQGGALLPDTCSGTKITYKTTDGRKVRTKTCNCYSKHGRETRLVVTYDPAESKKERHAIAERGGGFATVCAVCDSVGAWPIFEHVMEDEG